MKKIYAFILILAFSCSKKSIDNLTPTTQTTPNTPINSASVSVKGYSSITPTSTVELQSNAIMVRDDINSRLLDITGKSITYQNTTETNAIKDGDVLYSLPSTKAPNGYAAVVIKKTVQGDKILLETRTATMTEVFKKLKEPQTFKPNFISHPPVFYDAMDPNNRGRQVLDDGKLLSLDRIKTSKITEKSIELEYILYDIDKNFKTTSDQFIFTISINHNLTNTNFEIDESFKMYGEHQFSITGGIYLEVERSGTDALLENIKKNFAAATLGKKIRICTLPIPVNPAASLVAKPAIVIYAVFELDVKGNIKVYLSKEDLGYNFSYNSADKTKSTFNLLTSKPLDFGLEATVEGKIKLGMGIGGVIDFPMFKIEKDGEFDNSFAGIFNEIGFAGSLTLSGSISTNAQGRKCKTLSISPEAYYEAYLDAEIGLGKLAIEQNYSIYKAPLKSLESLKLEICQEDVGDISTGLLAYYPFSGNTKDSSGNKLDAIALSGAVPTTDRNGKINKAYLINGKQSGIKLSTSKKASVLFSDTTHLMNQIKSKLTLAAWVYIDKAFVGKFPLFNKSGNIIDLTYGVDSYRDNHFNLDIEPSYFAGAGKDNVIISGSNTACYSEHKIPLTNSNFDIYFPKEVWMHVAITYDGPTVKTYFNGSLVKETTAPNVGGKSCFQNPKTGHFSPLYIGAKHVGNYDGTNAYGQSVGNGKIDEVYIFNRALADIDIKTLYLSKN